MAQAATNPKIEELRGRLKADPKSRLFYPLAEELRKVSQFTEAESVLRLGLSSHPTYLSAWVSLGRVLRDQKKNAEAVESLNKALQLDPGNVVAARLLADAYLDLGEKVEAIKKYKLVYALLPSDDTLEGTIEKLESEINAPPLIPVEADAPFEITGRGGMGAAPPPVAAEPPAVENERVFDDTASALLKQERVNEATGDNEPMRAAHTDSPFEEPGVIEGYGADAFAIEQPGGMHETGAPMTAELPMPLPFESLPAFEPLPDEPPAPPPLPPEPVVAVADEADVFEPANSAIAPGIVTQGYSVTSSMDPIDEADFARTIRMADLYAAEGSFDEARDIYEDLLARDPSNATIRSKLDAIPAAAPPPPPPPPAQQSRPAPVSETPVHVQPPSSNPKVEKLESWLARVKRV